MEKINIIIVCEKEHEKYANYLRQLISENTSKTIDAIVWNTKEYNNNKAHISNDEYILFIGINKTSIAEKDMMKNFYNEFGLTYSWLGTKGIIYVDEKIMGYQEYEEFYNFFSKKDIGFKKIIYPKFEKINVTLRNVTDFVTELPVFKLLKPLKNKSSNFEKMIHDYERNTLDQQYKALVYMFYNYGLKNFIKAC